MDDCLIQFGLYYFVSWSKFSKVLFFFQAKFKVQQMADEKECIIECEGIGLKNPHL